MTVTRHTSAARVTGSLAWRSVALIPRVPSTFIPSLVFPIFSVIAFAGAFSAVARLPGFPADTMVDWVVPFSVVQGAAFAGVTTGFGMARDIQSRFFDRLLLSPVRHSALVTGPLAAALLRAVVPFAVVLVAGALAGVNLPGGPLGLVTLFLAAEGSAVVAAGWSIGLALRFRSMKAAPLIQMGLFMTMFLSTAQVPLSVMTGWLHAVARVNPMTNVLRLARQGFVGEVTWDGTWPGLLVLAAGAGLLGSFAVRGLRRLVP
jgi:ABC-2 type transport system permease protein